MALEKGFLKNKTTVFQLNEKQIIIGLVLFLLIAITFFNFLHIIRLFGIFFDRLSNDFEPFYFTKEGEFYYSFLFAFISINFSFGLVYNYWFEKPSKYFIRYNYKRKFALNQQRTLNWFFIYWFFKLAFVFGIFTDYFNELNVYIEYKEIIIIFIIAFIGQIWISIRPMIKKNTFKWFLIVVITCLSSSFLVSKINIVNPEKIQNKLIQNNLIYKHDVHIVKSKVTTKIEHRSLTFDIIIPNNTNQNIIFEGKEINITHLVSHVENMKLRIAEVEIPFLRPNLIIDKNVKMKFIYNFKKMLNNTNIERVLYSAKEIGDKRPFYYKSKYGLGMYLPNSFIERKDSDLSQELEIKILKNKKYLFNNDTISERNLTKKITTSFQKEGAKSIRVLFNKENTFEEYFSVLEHSKVAVDQLRNIYSKNAYGVDFKKLNRVQNRPIKEKYRWHIIDQME